MEKTEDTPISETESKIQEFITSICKVLS